MYIHVSYTGLTEVVKALDFIFDTAGAHGKLTVSLMGLREGNIFLFLWQTIEYSKDYCPYNSNAASSLFEGEEISLGYKT